MINREDIEKAMRAIIEAGLMVEEIEQGEKFSLTVEQGTPSVEIDRHMMVMFAMGIKTGRLACVRELKNTVR